MRWPSEGLVVSPWQLRQLARKGYRQIGKVDLSWRLSTVQ